MSPTRTPALGFLMVAVIAVSALTGTVLYGVYRAGTTSEQEAR